MKKRSYKYRQERVNNDIETTNWGGYHDLYVQSNTSLLANVFPDFWNMCIEIFELDPVILFL